MCALRLRPLLLLAITHAATADILGFNFSPRTDPAKVQVLVGTRPSAQQHAVAPPTCCKLRVSQVYHLAHRCYRRPSPVSRRLQPQQPGLGLGQILPIAFVSSTTTQLPLEAYRSSVEVRRRGSWALLDGQCAACIAAGR
jgi:hypothetical protein